MSAERSNVEWLNVNSPRFWRSTRERRPLRRSTRRGYSAFLRHPKSLSHTLNRKMPVLLLASVLTGYATLVGAASLPSGDTQDWVTYHVILGDQILQFEIPPGVNRDFMDTPVPKRIDLQNRDAFDEAGSAGILSRHWDYRKNCFAPHEGTLTAAIGVNFSEQPLDGLTALRGALRRQADLIYKQALIRDPEYRGPRISPSRFDPAKVAGRDGWHVSYRVLPSGYVVPLDTHHYLGVGIYNSVSRPDWRADAQAAARAILESIRIEPRH
jgi:hypothetical protein